MIEDMELILGEKPELKRGHDSIGEHYVDEPLSYDAVFYLKPYDAVIIYNWKNGLDAATVTLYGEEQRIDKVEEIIKKEHQRLDGKLSERKIFDNYTLLDFDGS